MLAKQKQQSGNRERSELLGSDPKQTRAEIRSNLREGYYISHSGKKAIRVLHDLGRCYMLPGVDYLSFTFGGTTFPDSCVYDTVCKWCAKSAELKDVPGSSGTNTSSSSDDLTSSMSHCRVSNTTEVRQKESRRDSSIEVWSTACFEFFGTPMPKGPAETLELLSNAPRAPSHRVPL